MDRSDFQASMLYYAGGTYLASSLLGDGGHGFQELVQLAGNRMGGFVPGGLADQVPQEATEALADAAPEGLNLDALYSQGLGLLAGGGWALGTVGAALLRRLQAAALAVLALVSGDGLSAAYAQDVALQSSDRAATLLEAVTFLTAAAGLSAMAKNGAGKMLPRRFRKLRFSV